jgi:hypothetical protein
MALARLVQGSGYRFKMAATISEGFGAAEAAEWTLASAYRSSASCLISWMRSSR